MRNAQSDKILLRSVTGEGKSDALKMVKNANSWKEVI